MNYRHEFMRGVMRKLGYILATLAVAGVLSMLGSFKANAHNWSACQNQATSTCTRAQALADATNMTAARQHCTAAGVGPTQGYSAPDWNPALITNPPTESTNPDGSGGITGHYKMVYVVNGASTACGADTFYYKPKNCATNPPLPTGTWVINNALGGSAGVCKDGCGYTMGSTSVIPCQTVDGSTYCHVGGATPNSEITCAADGSSDDGFGPPPSDSDSDGTSDNNDGAPNNPGSTTGDGNPPSQPQGPEGPKEDGSKACGGTGQPACPPEGEGSGDGDGKGSGNGNTSGGGGDCNNSPTASGDAILANILFQTWKTRCAAETIAKGGTAVTGGGGEGEGDGKVVQDGGCTPQGSVAGFYCSGDAIACKSAEKLAIANCRAQATDADGNGQPDWTQGDSPEIPGDGDGNYEEPEFGINVGTGGLDTSDLFGGGSCPSFSFSIFGEAVSTSDIPEWCGMVAIMRAAVLIMGAYLALRILYGGI